MRHFLADVASKVNVRLATSSANSKKDSKAEPERSENPTKFEIGFSDSSDEEEIPSQSIIDNVRPQSINSDTCETKDDGGSDENDDDDEETDKELDVDELSNALAKNIELEGSSVASLDSDSETSVLVVEPRTPSKNGGGSDDHNIGAHKDKCSSRENSYPNVKKIVLSFTPKYGWGRRLTEDKKYMYITTTTASATKSADNMTVKKTSNRQSTHIELTSRELMAAMKTWVNTYPNLQSVTLLEPQLDKLLAESIPQMLASYDALARPSAEDGDKDTECPRVTLHIKHFESPCCSRIPKLIEDCRHHITALKFFRLPCDHILTLLSKHQRHLSELEVVNFNLNAFEWPYSTFPNLKKLRIIKYDIPAVDHNPLKISSSKFPAMVELCLGYLPGGRMGQNGLALCSPTLYENVVAEPWPNVKRLELLFIPPILKDRLHMVFPGVPDVRSIHACFKDATDDEIGL